MTDDQIRELLREMRGEAVPADSLARVRMRVEERTAARRVRGWIPVIAFAAMVVVLTLVLWPDHPSRPTPAPAPVVATVKPTEPPAVAPVSKRAAVRRRAKAATAAIRIETADPDVVLILMTDGGED